MSKITGNEPINPLIGKNTDGTYYWNTPGLTIRQHFAIQCLQGILSNPALYTVFAKSDKDPNEAAEFYALVAVEHADAMIEQLNKEKPEKTDWKPTSKW